MRAIGGRLATRVARRLQCDPRPDLWFTYHVHHKAPDLVGPAVAEALRIPYVIAEASIAPRQSHGPWAEGHADALAAIRAADAVISLNPADLPELARHCDARLPRFAVPRYYDIVADLPRTENGKVLKYRLREQGVTPGAWDRTL